MEKTIVCSSCGAVFEEEAVKCPYCGSTNIRGAEKDYMDKLENVRETMEDLDEVPAQELGKAIKRQSRKIRFVMLTVAVISLILIACHLISENVSKIDYRSQYQWRLEHYPQLDELYNEGKYDELVDLAYNDLANDKDCILYEWEHYQFMETYDMLKSLNEDLDEYTGKELKDYQLKWIFYSEWRAKEVIYSKEKYLPGEYEALLPMLEKSEMDFNTRWNMSEEDYDIFYSYLKDPNQGYVPLSITDEYIEKWLKENR